MAVAVTFAVNVLLLSALYVLVSVGFTLLFAVGGVLNLGYGALVTLGGFTAYTLVQTWGQSLVVGVAGGTAVAGVAAVCTYLVIRRVEESEFTVLAVTLVLGLATEYLLRELVTPAGQRIAFPQLLTGELTIFGRAIEQNLVLIFASAWAFVLVLWIVVRRTRTGRAMMATSMSRRGATLVGIDRTRISVVTWLLAGLFAGFAGVMLTSFQTGHWQMGLRSMMVAFAVVVLGGIGSIRGSVVAAHVVGFLETATVTFLDGGLSGLTPFLVLIVALLVRPQGLFGREAVRDR